MGEYNIKFQLTKFGAAFLSTIIITACSSSNDNTETAGQTGTNSAPYVGSWTTGCVVSQLNVGDNTFFTYDLQIDTTTWQFIQSGYLDESCTIQEQGTPDTGISIRGTATFTGTYTDEGEITTADGLQANNLRMTLDTFTNTLDEPGDESDTPVGTTSDALVYVSDTSVLFLDDILLGINEEPGTLVLTLPFNAVQ